jgi:lipopolysaccharide transport system ATP-binding protein
MSETVNEEKGSTHPLTNSSTHQPSPDIAIRVDHISKKFCRYLRRSMRYGMHDICRNLLRMSTKPDRLRKDEFWAVDDVSFDLKRGEILGIIGQNGSGKSTILKMLNGIFMPDKGKIEINGRVGALIEIGAGFHPLLTGRENIYVNGAILGMSKEELDDKFDDIVEFADIGDFIDTPVKFYSSGMFVRLGFAVAVHCEPDILLVDEVLAVGDSAFVAKSARKIRDLIDGDTTVVFISHNMHVVSSICEKVLVLDRGRCIYLGPTDKSIELYEKTVLDKQILLKHSIEPSLQTDVGILRIDLLNGSGEKVTEVDTADSLKINVILESNSQIENPVFGIRMFRLDGTTCWNEKSLYHNVQTGVIKGRYEFTCHLKKVQVTTGYYYFIVNIFEGKISGLLAKGASERFFVQSHVPLRDEQTDIYHPLLEWEVKV